MEGIAGGRHLGVWRETQGVRDEGREEDSWPVGEPEGDQRARLSEARKQQDLQCG